MGSTNSKSIICTTDVNNLNSNKKSENKNITLGSFKIVSLVYKNSYQQMFYVKNSYDNEI
jgi:hypothetical protein